MRAYEEGSHPAFSARPMFNTGREKPKGTFALMLFQLLLTS